MICSDAALGDRLLYYIINHMPSLLRCSSGVNQLIHIAWTYSARATKCSKANTAACSWLYSVINVCKAEGRPAARLYMYSLKSYSNIGRVDIAIYGVPLFQVPSLHRNRPRHVNLVSNLYSDISLIIPFSHILQGANAATESRMTRSPRHYFIVTPHPLFHRTFFVASLITSTSFSGARINVDRRGTLPR